MLKVRARYPVPMYNRSLIYDTMKIMHFNET